MKTFILKLLADLLILMLRLLDSIFGLFKQLSGIEKINTTKGDAVDLTEYFLQADTITRIFWSLFMLSIIVIAACIIVTVVKNTINISGKERKPHSKTVGQGLGSIIITIVMFIIMVSGISISNTMLSYVNETFNNDTDMTMGLTVFDMSVEESYDVDWEKTLHEDNLNDDGTIKGYIYKEEPMLNSSGKEMLDPITGEVLMQYVMEDGWRNGYSIKDIQLEKDDADSIFGKYETKLGLPQDSLQKGQDKILKVDINAFNFLVAYFATVSLLVVITFALLGLVKRLYDLVILFLAMPLVIATIAHDDGARFKLWRETVVSKVILAYGSVFSVNVFVILIGLIQDLSFYGPSGTVLKLFLIVGGALSINGGQLLFARILGTSAEESRDMAQSFRAVMAGSRVAGGVAVGLAAKRGLDGKMHMANGTVASLFTGAAKVGKAGLGAINTGGKLLGGNAYTGAVAKIKTGATNLGNTLRRGSSSFMDAGGLVGMASAPAAMKSIKNKGLDISNDTMGAALRQEKNKGDKK